MIWLPAFFPHVAGVVVTVKMAKAYPQYQVFHQTIIFNIGSFIMSLYFNQVGCWNIKIGCWMLEDNIRLLTLTLALQMGSISGKFLPTTARWMSFEDQLYFVPFLAHLFDSWSILFSSCLKGKSFSSISWLPPDFFHLDRQTLEEILWKCFLGWLKRPLKIIRALIGSEQAFCATSWHPQKWMD